ncbi:MAG: radical SAM protein [Myxococcota bacterium]
MATFDLTRRCPLRCRHCYFFRGPLPPDDDLDDATFLAGLEDTVRRHGIRSAFWVGGEPLLRAELLRKAVRSVPRNAVATSGVVPIPADLEAGLLVSVDGPEELHDGLRGSGAFQRTRRNLEALRARTFFLSVTFTSSNLAATEHLPALREELGAAGILVGFHVGPPGDPLRVAPEQRERAVDRLQRLPPGTVVNSELALEMLRPSCAEVVAHRCIYRHRAIAFDVQLRPKTPCTFGPAASCDACGCGIVAAQAALTLGDEDSRTMLETLFPLRADAGAR